MRSAQHLPPAALLSPPTSEAKVQAEEDDEDEEERTSVAGVEGGVDARQLVILPQQRAVAAARPRLRQVRPFAPLACLRKHGKA